MTKHKHKFQYAYKTRVLPRGKDTATFICECGAMKIVELRKVKDGR